MSSITPRVSPEFREQAQPLPFPAVSREDGSLPKLRRPHSMPDLGQGAYGKYAANQLKLLEPDEVSGTTVRYTPDFTRPGAEQDLDAFVRSFKGPDGHYTESAMSRITGLKKEDLPEDVHGLRYTLASLLGGATADQKGASRVSTRDLKAAAGFLDFWQEGSPNGQITKAKRKAVQDSFFHRGEAAQARSAGLSAPFSLTGTQELGLEFDPELQALLTPTDNPFTQFVAPPAKAAIEEKLLQGALSPDTAEYVHASAERIRPFTGKSWQDVFKRQNNELRDRQNREGFRDFRQSVGQVGKHLS